MTLRSPVVMRFAQEVTSALGPVKVSINPPSDPKGRWFLDLTFNGRTVVVEQQVTEGYLGVSLATGDMGYGEKPDRVFTEFVPALVHTLHLLAVAP